MAHMRMNGKGKGAAAAYFVKSGGEPSDKEK